MQLTALLLASSSEFVLTPVHYNTYTYDLSIIIFLSKHLHKHLYILLFSILSYKCIFSNLHFPPLQFYILMIL